MTTEELFLLTPDERQAWELCEKATPGPWLREGNLVYALASTGRWVKGVEEQCNRMCIRITGQPRITPEGEEAAMAELVFSALTALPDALRTIAGLRAELEDVRESIWQHKMSIAGCEQLSGKDGVLLGNIRQQVLNDWSDQFERGNRLEKEVERLTQRGQREFDAEVNQIRMREDQRG